jgi:beta-galactosidase
VLIGSFPGAAYARNHRPSAREFFAGLLEWAGVEPQVQSSDPAVTARLHEGSGGTYLWVVNPTRTVKTATISVPQTFRGAVELWQESSHPSVSGGKLTTTVEDRNAAVIRLESR